MLLRPKGQAISCRGHFLNIFLCIVKAKLFRIKQAFEEACFILIIFCYDTNGFIVFNGRYKVSSYDLVKILNVTGKSRYRCNNVNFERR